MSNIEVETRALLSVDQRDEMLAYMHTLGIVEEIERVAIDFSGKDREYTNFVRAENGLLSLVAKTGGVADTQRKEVEAQDVDAGGEDAAQQMVDATLGAHNLHLLSAEEWKQWVRGIDERVDSPFEYSPENARALVASLAGFAITRHEA